MSSGAGGGSIAWIDEGGSLRVGPRSAGSSPGPACYGLGGEDPTITDANLVLGRLDPSLGGKISLDLEAARRAIARVADELEMDLLDCAEGIIRIATESMASAIKMISVDRGRDPRDYTIVTFGGAGAMHTAAIAMSLGIEKVIVPPFAGVASAFGATAMDFRLDSEQTWYHECAAVEREDLEKQFLRLEEETRERLVEHGSPDMEIELVRTAGMRYVGQSYEVETPVPGGHLGPGSVAALTESFHDAHEREHGVRSDDFDVAIVNLRVTAIGRLPKPELDSSDPGGATTEGESGSRPVYFGGRWIDTPVHPGGKLRELGRIPGPAIIQYEETTLVLPPGSEGTIDEDQNVVIAIVDVEESIPAGVGSRQEEGE